MIVPVDDTLGELATSVRQWTLATVERQVTLLLWGLVQDDLDPRTLAEAAWWELHPSGTRELWWGPTLLLAWYSEITDDGRVLVHYTQRNDLPSGCREIFGEARPEPTSRNPPKSALPT